MHIQNDGNGNQSITFEQNDDYDDWSFLIEKKSLTKIIFDMNHKPVPISVFNELTNVKEIGLPIFDGILLNPNILELGLKWSEKSKIGSCEKLKKVSVFSCKDGTSLFQQLSNLPELDELILFRCNFENRSDYSLQHLKKLTIHYGTFQSLKDVFESCPNLKYLKINKLKKLSDYSDLEYLSKLETLIISESKQIDDLSFVRKLKKLKDLRIVSTKIKDDNTNCLSDIQNVMLFKTGKDK